MQILILRSVESTYVRVVGIPDDMDDDDAYSKAEEIINRVKQDHPDEWSWEEIEPALEKAGFIALGWIHGPYWDA